MSFLGALVALKEQTHKAQLICVKEDANPSTINVLQSMEKDLDIIINRVNARVHEREAIMNKTGGWCGGR